jgi:hypothetical protein
VHVVVVVVEDDGLLQHHVNKLASWTCKSLIQIMRKQTLLCKFVFTFFGNPMISFMSQ